MTEPTTVRRVEYVRLDEIRKAPRNPKRHDGDGIRGSIGHFGLAELPTIDERTGLLVAGHGRLEQIEAMRRDGAAPPDGVTVDDDGMWRAPIIRGWASKSDADAEAYLVASYRLAERGGWDDLGLADMLTSLAAVDFDLAMVAGFDAGALEDLLAAAVEPPFFPEDGPGGDPYRVAGEDPFGPERGAPAAAGPTERVHGQVPATGSGYAETDEEEAKRSERIAGYEPRAPKGTVEMILIYSVDDRAEVGRLVSAARGVLGTDEKTAEIVLRALRLFMVVLDDRFSDKPISLAQLALRAGLE